MTQQTAAISRVIRKRYWKWPESKHHCQLSCDAVQSNMTFIDSAESVTCYFSIRICQWWRWSTHRICL